MNVFQRIKNFFDKIFKKNQKMIESPKKIENNKPNNTFIESLKMKTPQIRVNTIESLECINDGTGFQKIKK